MNELKTISALVKHILEEDVPSRNSDNTLYLKVLEHYSVKKGIDLGKLSVLEFLKELDRHELPGFETVRRSRQKVQETFPELAASEAVGRSRSKNETAYRVFAKGKV